jgi:hypothetical protein
MRRNTMTQYLLSVHSVDGQAGEQMTGEQMTGEQMRQSYQQVMALQAEMKSAGTWVFAPRIPATGRNGSSRHALASSDSRSNRIIKCRSELLIRGCRPAGHRVASRSSTLGIAVSRPGGRSGPRWPGW